MIDVIVQYLKPILSYVMTLISLALVVQGGIEYKVFMTFDEKSDATITRISVLIGFGLANLSYIFLK